MNKILQQTALLTCMLMALALPVKQACANKNNPGVLGAIDQVSMVNLMLGKAEMVDLDGNIADVLVADPNIADVKAIKSNRLYIVGSALGDTNIIALDAQGNVVKKFNVHVQMDVEKLTDMIGNLYPNEDVQIQALTDQVIITGNVSTPSIANKIVNLVGHYAGEIQELGGTSVDEVVVNMLGVQGERQVMLRVKIVEASRAALKELGLESSSVGANAGDVGFNAATAGSLGLTAPVQLGVAALNYTSGGLGNLRFLARALEEEGILNTLAEPNLTAISGEQAGFLAGGEYPIPTSLDQNGNVVVTFKPFGVSLNFRPVVMSKDRISLQINTEVSSVSTDNNLQLNGITIPSFSVRRADTTVEMASGGTLMMAGLIQSESISGLTQLPGIGDIPVVGDLMKSDSFKRNESEVIVMVTPYLVEPFAQNHSTLAPSKEMAHVTSDDTFNGAYVSAEDTRAPYVPTREESKMDVIFADNIRRLYGKKAPTNMLDQTVGFGYMVK